MKKIYHLISPTGEIVGIYKIDKPLLIGYPQGYKLIRIK